MPQLAAGSDLTAQPVALHFSHPRSILFQTELEEEMHRGVSGLARIIGVQQRSAVRPDELNRPFDLVGSCNHAVADEIKGTVQLIRTVPLISSGPAITL